MFSTYENRFLRFEAWAEDRKVSLDFSGAGSVWLQRRQHLAVGLPTERNLRRLGRALLDAEWVSSDLQFRSRADSSGVQGRAVTLAVRESASLRPKTDSNTWSPQQATYEIDRLRLQVWRIEYDATTGLARSVPIGEVVEVSG